MNLLDPARYQVVIRSARWRALRLRLIRARGPRCERCNIEWAPGYPPRLELHHKTYERLGRERDVDVVLLCRGCHPEGDRERAAAARVRAAEALDRARFHGWCEWRYSVGLSADPDDFEQFLDRVDDDDYDDV